jgi:hypothetical protein
MHHLKRFDARRAKKKKKKKKKKKSKISWSTHDSARGELGNAASLPDRIRSQNDNGIMFEPVLL